MLSKCSAFGRNDDVAQKEKNSGMFRESGFRKLSYSLYVYKVLIHVFTLAIKILLTISLVLRKK